MTSQIEEGTLMIYNHICTVEVLEIKYNIALVTDGNTEWYENMDEMAKSCTRIID